MALPSLASLEDLSARMPTEPDAVRGQARLDDASAWIRNYTRLSFVDDDGKLKIDPGQEVVVPICCAIAQRVLANPNGTESIGLGDYQEAWANASTDAYLTASERRALDGLAGGRSRIGSIATERRSIDCDDETLWLPVEPAPPDGPVLPWL